VCAVRPRNLNEGRRFYSAPSDSALRRYRKDRPQWRAPILLGAVASSRLLSGPGKRQRTRDRSPLLLPRGVAVRPDDGW